MEAILYIVSTPIGNMADISQRALRILREVSWIAAEDTRHTQKLLHNYGIDTPMLSLHQHNEKTASNKILDLLADQHSVALVSDAGTPLISDPGYHLLSEARKHNIKVLAIPGATALVAALSVSGFSADKFIFAGFLPSQASSRQACLEDLCEQRQTIVFYEAPHRLLSMLTDLANIFGADRQIAIIREMTKRFESFYSGTAKDLVAMVQVDNNMQRGELVVISQGYSGKATTSVISEKLLLTALLAELNPSTASRIAANLLNKRKQDLYQQALQLKAQRGNSNNRPRE